jgi:hypothetical protein
MPRDTSQTPYDLRRVPNCESLTIYRIPRSRFLQYRFRLIGKKRYKRGSTQCEDLRKATDVAKAIWLTHVSERERLNIPREKQFGHHVKQLQIEQEKKVAREQRNPRFAKTDGYRLKALEEYFKDDPVDAIDGQRIRDFQDHLYEQNPKISKVTMKHYFVVLRKVLKQAAMAGAIQTLPQFPDVGGSSGINPRTGFTLEEYKKLRDHLKKKAATDSQYAEVYDLALFLTNSLLRPSEVKYLTHQHVRFDKDSAGKTLRIRPPNPKVKAYDYETFTMEGAVEAYKRMLTRYPETESYVFFAKTQNRDYALRMVGDLFGQALTELGMKQTRDGRRTLYSLRHSGISWRLENGEGQVFDVARWARTSVAMIEKYYASAYRLDAVAPQLRSRGRKPTSLRSSQAGGNRVK